MSLLLDALKKAADDKQRASQSETVGAVSIAVQDGAQEDTQTTDEATYAEGLTTESEVSSSAEVLNFAESPVQETPRSAVEDSPDDSEALSLDPIETVRSESVLIADDSELESESTDTDKQADNKEKKPANGIAPGNNTVSDEALSLLIRQTNRDAKYGKRIIVISVLLASMAVLVSGGIYYYYEMQAEMASLERKHQLAMQRMRAKTSDEKVHEKSEIIRSFVNKSEPEEKVKLAKKHIISERQASEKHTQKKIEAQVVAKKQTATANKNIAGNDKSVLSIQRTNKADPLGEKLDTAWLVYDSGQYDKAEKLYAEALSLENNNRDALLGLAAIAIHKKDPGTAKKHYLALLKQDPRDPIATAAMTGLHSDETSIESDEEYLLTMLESNPKAAHLNFALGNIYAQKGEWKAAQQSYFNAWQQDNENADYVFNLAISMDQLGKQQQALQFYSDSLHKSTNKQVSFSREAVHQRIKVLSER